MMAKASGGGVCATSAPRILKAQATACGSETTSASARNFASSARMRAACRPPLRRQSADRCRATARRGGGRSRQIASIRSGSTATNVAEAAAQALPSRSAPSTVQPGIGAEAVVQAEVRLDQQVGGSGQVLYSEQRRVDLIARLQRVAAVDEQNRAPSAIAAPAGPGEARRAKRVAPRGRGHIRSGGDRRGTIQPVQIVPCQLGA